MITASLAARHFVCVLSEKFGPITQSDERQLFLTGQQQANVEITATAYEMNAIEHLAVMLDQAADELAKYLKRAGANTCFRLPLPDNAKEKVVESSTHSISGGMSVRCILTAPKYWPGVPEQLSGKWIFRFDVLYRNEDAQAAA